MMTTRERIAEAAVSNGWRVVSESRDFGAVEYRRRSRHVRVYFNVRGGVVSASTQHRFIRGRDRAGQVIAELSS
jgi:hypothetical protein